MPELSVSDALRPQSLSEFGGQDQLVKELGTVLSAAAQRLQLPDHILFSGPPGTGKTTLAGIVAQACGVTFIATSAPVLAKPVDLDGLLARLSGPTVIFIDEIHRLAKPVAEVLYSAMEDHVLDFKVGQGVEARAVRIALKPFVLIGATTDAGKLPTALRERFGYQGYLRPYTVEALSAIVARSAGLLQLNLDQQAARVVADRAKGTPRVANSLLRRMRDWAQVFEVSNITQEHAIESMEYFGVDTLGLTWLGQEVLRVLCQAERPIGIRALAAQVSEDPSSLENEIEPHLLRIGLLERTPAGRMPTAKAYRHLGLDVPEGVK